MSHMRLWVAGGIIACVVIVGFILLVPRARDGGQSATVAALSSSTPAVSLHDVFKKGIHTITGSVVTPNACSAVSAEAVRTGEASSSTITVALTLTPSEGVCLQVPTTVKFSTTVTAPANLPIIASVNGAVATTTGL